MKSILLIKKLSGLVEMTSGLVSASLLAIQASCKNDFLCTLGIASLSVDNQDRLHNFFPAAVIVIDFIYIPHFCEKFSLGFVTP